MNELKYDVVVLTEDRYANPERVNDYIKNVLVEDSLLVNALMKEGLSVGRFSWSDHEVNWDNVKSVIFRTTWDYFDRYEEFKKWFDQIRNKVMMFNSADIIEWNRDKIYLAEMADKRINIPETIFIGAGREDNLSSIVHDLSTEEFVLKPNVSGAARLTYRLHKNELNDFEETYKNLISEEDFMVQSFQLNILSKGEISLVLIDGNYSHAVLKRGKGEDFRVQDDFGGSVYEYHPSDEEISFAKQCYEAIDGKPLYCRVDIIWDNDDELALSELEMIEPELWFRNRPAAAEELAKAINREIA